MSDTPRPMLIAGPCSAESEAQVMEAASCLKAGGISVFRAGLWKPRTHPLSFEGVGRKGLPWLSRVRNELGMKTCTEVAGASHVEACLEGGVDMVWIGARTTASPFQVQEIADALEGSGLPVLVKNPVCPDINLWAGAVERLALKGVEKLYAVHRGCSSYGTGRYRNDPQWTLSLDFQIRFPEIPLLCDPSHMGGSAAYVGEISRKAMGLGFDGLMIEVHPHPEAALSDAAQQITPAALFELLSGLEAGPAGVSFDEKAAELRGKIDVLDSELLKILSERVELCREIGRMKKAEGIDVIQPGRWKMVLDDVCSGVDALGLDPAFVRRIFNDIHDNSIEEQLKL